MAKLSQQNSLSPSALSRHKKHLAAKIVTDRLALLEAQSEYLLELLASLEFKALEIINAALSAGNLTIAVRGFRELFKIITLANKIKDSLIKRPVLPPLSNQEHLPDPDDYNRPLTPDTRRLPQ